MRQMICLFAWIPILGGALHADWKITTRTGDSQVTEYFKGTLKRTDSPPGFTEVLDFDHRSQVSWRSDLHQYSMVEWPALEQPADSSPGPVIVIERFTTDTGERKQFFGRTARHLVSRMTRTDGPGTVIDGWYIDAPGLPEWKRGAGGSVAVLTVSTVGQKPGPPRIELKQTGPSPEGLPVWQKTVISMALPGGSRQTNETVSEVTELVEGALPDKLFQPPDGYRRVASLTNDQRYSDRAPHTWADLLQAHWQMIQGWFANLFGTPAAR